MWCRKGEKEGARWIKQGKCGFSTRVIGVLIIHLWTTMKSLIQLFTHHQCCVNKKTDFNFISKGTWSRSCSWIIAACVWHFWQEMAQPPDTVLNPNCKMQNKYQLNQMLQLRDSKRRPDHVSSHQIKRGLKGHRTTLSYFFQAAVVTNGKWFMSIMSFCKTFCVQLSFIPFETILHESFGEKQLIILGMLLVCVEYEGKDVLSPCLTPLCYHWFSLTTQ